MREGQAWRQHPSSPNSSPRAAPFPTQPGFKHRKTQAPRSEGSRTQHEVPSWELAALQGGAGAEPSGLTCRPGPAVSVAGGGGALGISESPLLFPGFPPVLSALAVHRG